MDFRFWIADFGMLDLILFWTGSTGLTRIFLFAGAIEIFGFHLESQKYPVNPVNPV
jgi:hypothetical protein